MDGLSALSGTSLFPAAMRENSGASDKERLPTSSVEEQSEGSSVNLYETIAARRGIDLSPFQLNAATTPPLPPPNTEELLRKIQTLEKQLAKQSEQLAGYARLAAEINMLPSDLLGIPRENEALIKTEILKEALVANQPVAKISCQWAVKVFLSWLKEDSDEDHLESLVSNLFRWLREDAANYFNTADEIFAFIDLLNTDDRFPSIASPLLRKDLFQQVLKFCVLGRQIRREIEFISNEDFSDSDFETGEGRFWKSNYYRMLGERDILDIAIANDISVYEAKMRWAISSFGEFIEDNKFSSMDQALYAWIHRRRKGVGAIQTQKDFAELIKRQQDEVSYRPDCFKQANKVARLKRQGREFEQEEQLLTEALITGKSVDDMRLQKLIDSCLSDVSEDTAIALPSFFKSLLDLGRTLTINHSDYWEVLARLGLSDRERSAADFFGYYRQLQRIWCLQKKTSETDYRMNAQIDYECSMLIRAIAENVTVINAKLKPAIEDFDQWLKSDGKDPFDEWSNDWLLDWLSQLENPVVYTFKEFKLLFQRLDRLGNKVDQKNRPDKSGFQRALEQSLINKKESEF